MKIKQILYLAILLSAPLLVGGKDILLTPDNATDRIKSALPGDRILFQEGSYVNPIEFQGLKGSRDKQIIIGAAPGAKVVMDGTDVLPDNWTEVTPDSPEGQLIQPVQWERMQGKVYAQKLDTPIYALIYDDRLMSDARWPNARWDDPWRLDRYMVLRRASENSLNGDIDDGLPTKNALDESSKWLHYDRSQLTHRDEMLKDTGISFEGAIVLMSHTWGSWATRITGHEAGSNRFNYDNTFEGSGSLQKEAYGFLNNRIGWKTAPKKKFHRSSHSGIHYFFVGLPALDIQEEWWYHEPTQTLYFISPDGERPAPGKARGKRRDFLLSVKKSEHVQIKGIEFYGSAAYMKECRNSRLEDCNFKFSSYHKFTVGNFDMPVTTRIENRDRKPHGNALINCQFTYLDGNAFEGRSYGLVINNILIYRTQQTTLGLDSRSMSINFPSVVRRVTIDGVGASVGIKGGGMDSVYELNNIMHFGGLQYDGASLQMGGRDKFVYRYNWSHDHPKRSYRFDAGSYPSYSNAFGEMSYNVAWNTPSGFAIKGDDHLIHNNVLIGDSGFELFNMKRWAGKNERTLVANNIVPFMSAGGHDWDKPVTRKRKNHPDPEVTDEYWMSETKVPDGHPTIVGQGASFFDDGNETGPRKAPLLAIRKNNSHVKAEELLRDPANLDFRPREDSGLIDAGHTITREEVKWKDIPITGSSDWKDAPDIGAYESNPDHYWIPGFKFAHASTPVPPTGSTTAKPDLSLMWLGGYMAMEHDLYIGHSEDAVADATRESKQYRGTFIGNKNICSFKNDLPVGKPVYWRVDAVRDGEVTKGEVWTFTVAQ